MRNLLPSLLLLVAACLGGPVRTAAADGATVHDEAANFEITLPPEKAGDWDVVPLDSERKDIKAHFKTEFTDSEPLATAEVQVLIFPIDRQTAARKIEALAAQWSVSMEGSLDNPRDVKEDKATLGGQPAYYRDLKGDLHVGSGVGHVTWYVTRMGKYAYILWVIRTYSAVGNEELEAEIASIRDSFKFLKIEEVKPDPKVKGGGPGPPAGAGANDKAKEPDPELLKREEMKLDYWRLKFVKPEGLLNVPPDKFDESEATNHLVAKFTRTGDQTYILIRVYAQLEKNQRYSIQEQADTYIKYFNQKYNEKARMEPEIEKDYKKFPLAKDAIRMKLTGRRTVPEITLWYLGQCKNERQYQIEIYMTGAEGEKAWKNQIDDFMKHFRPVDE